LISFFAPYFCAAKNKQRKKSAAKHNIDLLKIFHMASNR